MASRTVFIVCLSGCIGLAICLTLLYRAAKVVPIGKPQHSHWFEYTRVALPPNSYFEIDSSTDAILMSGQFLATCPQWYTWPGVLAEISISGSNRIWQPAQDIRPLVQSPRQTKPHIDTHVLRFSNQSERTAFVHYRLTRTPMQKADSFPRDTRCGEQLTSQETLLIDHNSATAYDALIGLVGFAPRPYRFSSGSHARNVKPIR